jgi:hypothetical protein
MRKRTKMKPVPALNLFERAVMRKAWSTDEMTTLLHSYLTADLAFLIQKTASMFFIIASAARVSKVAHDDADMLRIRDAVRTVAEHMDGNATDDELRTALATGITATMSLRVVVDEQELFHASRLLLVLHERTEGVTLQQYENLFLPST